MIGRIFFWVIFPAFLLIVCVLFVGIAVEHWIRHRECFCNCSKCEAERLGRVVT